MNKFRVYNIEEKKWVKEETVMTSSGDIFINNCKGLNIIKKNKLQLVSDNRYIIHQYIGIEDKNGVPIYEGDFVTNDIVTGVVVYDEGLCAYVVLNHKKMEYYNFYRGITDSITVIGNCLDNKELIPDEVGSEN